MRMTLLEYLSFATFVIFFFFSTVQLNYRRKLPVNYLLAGLYFSTGYQFFYYRLFSTGLLHNVSGNLYEFCYNTGTYKAIYGSAYTTAYDVYLGIVMGNTSESYDTTPDKGIRIVRTY